MSFLDELTTFLESVRAGEVAELRVSPATIAGHLRALETWFAAGSTDPADAAKRAGDYAEWMARCRKGLIEHLYERVVVQYPAPEQHQRLVELALASLIGDEFHLSASGAPDVVAELGPIRAKTLRVVAKDAAAAFKRYDPLLAPSPRRVARLLGLIRSNDRAVELSAAGGLFLQLGPRERLRWLLALELASSEDTRERDRLHIGLVKLLHERGCVGIDGYQTVWHSVLSQSWEHDHREPLERWTAFGVLKYSEVHPHTGEPYVHDSAAPPDEMYELTATGGALVDDLLSAATHPLRELASAMLADEEAVLPPGFQWTNAGRPANARALVRYSKILTHEVRNVLLPVQIAATQLVLRLDEPTRTSAQGHISTMEAGLARIFDFVDHWRRVMEQAEEPGAPFSIVAAVRDAIAASQPQLERPISLSVGRGVDGVEALGSRDLFTQAMAELIRNAVQAGGPRVRVSVEVEQDGAKVTIVISDDGPGVPPADRDRIFRRGVTSRPGGTGQGLANVRDIVQDMSGDIRVEEGAGGGARFVVTLPSHIKEAT